jgi:hypothetical protein
VLKQPDKHKTVKGFRICTRKAAGTQMHAASKASITFEIVASDHSKRFVGATQS